MDATVLPTGTVTLLFSDVEGSTLLLGRLGPAYAMALDGQREILRGAWSDHGGVELGTEGDSFFVAFASAPAAARAAAQAQQGLEAHSWPDAAQVRVRMGIHTGSPAVHDGGYVGMDVHRAARIAGAAHGGQVVLSETTARLVEGDPEVGLRDLGAHTLKDIAQRQRLFQLLVPGLPVDFPKLRTLGATSSLPTPATPLVGREGELAELSAVLEAPGVRLVTLTGPGGSGKTRLAIALARRLTSAFPDGVYFVPLAAVTAPDVMWTSIAEVLDAPAEGRVPPGLLDHVAHRTALFVLDNLEQVTGADTVVSELLTAAPQAVVVATSRRPLHVAAEHEHAVPPLELPGDASLAQAEGSGAVQLFVQHARKVRAGFALTAANAADVATVCRTLDGLPLAIELAAARTKMLSPRALLSRLDTALDIVGAGVDRPTRQQTLRDTIGWSYDLLTPELQGLFRTLGVFAGGADLEAVSAVAAGTVGADDPFDAVAELVDVSLVTVAETPDGEPRIRLLETIRAFARDQLEARGELDGARRRHALEYVRVAEDLRSLLEGNSLHSARARFEQEHDNFREALGWVLALQRDGAPTRDEVDVGLRLCSALHRLWWGGGYLAEGRRWLRFAIDRAGDTSSPELANCLNLLGRNLYDSGDPDGAHAQAAAAVAMLRSLDDPGRLLYSLRLLAMLEGELRRSQSARDLFQEAAHVARQLGDKRALGDVLADYALFEASIEHDFERSLQLNAEALTLALEIVSDVDVLLTQHNRACTLREMGRTDAAGRLMRELIPQALEFAEAGHLTVFAEDHAAILAELGDHRRAAVLLGAADSMRERLGTPRHPRQEAEILGPLARARAALHADEWDAAYGAGRASSVEEALRHVHETTY